MAYLVNPAGECDVWGKPSVATDYIGLGRKNLDTMMITENLLGRVEFGFAADRLGLGTLPYDINRTVATDPRTFLSTTATCGSTTSVSAACW